MIFHCNNAVFLKPILLLDTLVHMPPSCVLQMSKSGLRIPDFLYAWLSSIWRCCKKKLFDIVFVRTRSWYLMCLQTDPNSCAVAESSHSRDWTEYESFSNLLYLKTVGKRWKFTLNLSKGHVERKPCEMVQKVSGGESSGALWNQESNTTDHAITKREGISASKEERAHIHTPVPACACWEESFPLPGAAADPAGLRGRSAAPSHPASPLLLRHLHYFGGFAGLSYPDAVYFAKRGR